MEAADVKLCEDTPVHEAFSADPEALNALAEELRPKAIALAYTVTGSREDAFDAAQTAMLRVFARPESRSLTCPVIAALYESAHSAAVDIVRRRAPRGAREEIASKQVAQRSATMPDQELERRESIAALRDEMAALPAETAAVIALHHMDDLPVEEVSKKTGLTVDACKHRLSRGREHLRQRLERRGVALAGVAVLALLNEAFLSGKACAAEAAGGAGALGVGGTASGHGQGADPATSGPAASGSGAQGANGVASAPSHVKHSGLSNGSRKRTADETRSGMGSKLLVAAVAALILMCGWVVWKQKALPPVGARGGAAKETGDGDSTGGKANAAARWVSANVAADRMMPASLVADGPEVSLLATELSRNLLKSHRTGDGITLYASHDDGQQWSKMATFNDYSLGTIARTAEGVHLGVGLENEVGDNYHSSTHAGSYDLWHFKQADWFVIDAKGAVKMREPIWTFSNERPIFGSVTQIHAGGANWVFARRITEDNNFMRCDFLVASSKGTDKPQPLDITRRTPGTFFNEHPPAAWATDGQAAGFVFFDAEKIQLVHAFTADGGKTWTDLPIPFHFDTESDTKKLDDFEPIALTRDNKRLVLLFRMSSALAKITQENQNEAFFSQKYTMASDDLGRTWKEALPVSVGKKDKTFTDITGLAVTGDQFVISRNVLENSDESETSPRHVALLASKDAGATWSEVRTLSFKADSTDSVLYGNARGIYLGVRQVTPKNPNMLPATVSVHRLIGNESEQKETLFFDPAAESAKAAPNF